MIERIEIGRRNSNATVANGVAYMAITPEKPYDAGLSAAEQARQLVVKVDKKLELIGLTRSDIIFVQLILADIADVAAVNAVWDDWIDPASPPTRACIGAALADPAMKVEFIIQADASARGEGRG